MTKREVQRTVVTLLDEMEASGDSAFLRRDTAVGGSCKWMMGMLQLRQWRPEATETDLEQLDRADAGRLIQEVFMVRTRIAEIESTQTGLALTRLALTHGARLAIKISQRELGLNADGVIGPLSLVVFARQSSKRRIDAGAARYAGAVTERRDRKTEGKKRRTAAAGRMLRKKT